MTSHSFDLPREYNSDEVDDDLVAGILSEFIDSCDGAKQALRHNGAGDSVKWSTIEEDLARFSESHPDLAMVIHGEGEERFDVWDLYAKDGETEMCRNVTYKTEPDMFEFYGDE